ncbi:hypothetical protein pb186bvf_004090 [Paramecium bursaria]
MSEEQLLKIELLYKRQFFYSCLDELSRLEKQVLNNPEDDNDILYEIYDKQIKIMFDLNLCQQSQVILIKQIKLAQNNVLKLASSYAKMGKSCFMTCQYELTETYLLFAQQLLEKNKLTQSGEYALTLLQLGNYYRFMFKDELAESSLKQSLTIRQNISADYTLDIADSLHGLAQLYSDQAQLENALVHIEQAIKILESVAGKNHIKTAKSIYLKGNLYLRMKNTTENVQQAENLILQSLEINKQILGECSQECADCYHSLGKIKSQNLKSDEFIIYFTKAYNLIVEFYGSSHACIAILLNNFGRAFYERKRFDDAASCFEKSILIYQQLCGEHHGNLAITLKSCGDCHKEMGRYKQAQIDYEKSLQIYQKIDLNYYYTIQQLQQMLKEIRDKELEE